MDYLGESRCERVDVTGRGELGRVHENAVVQFGIEASEIDAAKDLALLQRGEHSGRRLMHVDDDLVEERRSELQIDAVDRRNRGREFARTFEV